MLLSGTSRCLFSDKYKTHKCSVGRAYSCWMLNLVVRHVTSSLYTVNYCSHMFRPQFLAIFRYLVYVCAACYVNFFGRSVTYVINIVIIIKVKILKSLTFVYAYKIIASRHWCNTLCPKSVISLSSNAIIPEWNFRYLVSPPWISSAPWRRPRIKVEKSRNNE